MELRKTILLTIDYELFFGPDSGTVKQCMILPTRRLIEMCRKHDCTMTVFWDIMHYYKLLELQETNPQLKEDRIEIENQIRELIENDHDIQLHIHPHWLDSDYINGKWVFDYKRFSLHQLSPIDDEKDINTISGCIKICKELLENLTQKFEPSHKVNSIRAGGYLIEPFDDLRESLRKNKVYIDSSVCPNRKIAKGPFSFDFTGYPDLSNYRFDMSPSVIDDSGYFLEIPIQSVYISIQRRFWYQFLKKIRNSGKERYGDGKGNTIVAHSKKGRIIHNKARKFLIPEYSQLTTDNCIHEKYNYLIDQSKNYSVQILHPKLMNEDSFQMMTDNLEKNRIKFISIKNFLKVEKDLPVRP